MTLFALDGRVPQIAEDTWIASDANVIGNVVLEDGVSIWFGCTLRGDNEEIRVGHGSNVQENVVCHTDPGCPLRIGSDCTIGHKAMLHGCTIGNRVLSGMRAMVMDGAVIEDEVLVAAGALVSPGKVLESGYLYRGSPARKIRELTDEEKDNLAYGASHYVKMKNQYLAELENKPK